MHFTQNILLYYIIHFTIFQVLYSIFIKKIKNKSPFIRAPVNYCHRLTNYDPHFTVFAFFCLFGQGVGSTEKSGSQRQKLTRKICKNGKVDFNFKLKSAFFYALIFRLFR